MKLNDFSHVHVRVRKLCQLLAYYTKMDLVSDLSNEFDCIRFMNKLSYLTIDYRNRVCYSMSHRITREEQQIIEEIMINLKWIEIGNKYQRIHK